MKKELFKAAYAGTLLLGLHVYGLNTLFFRVKYFESYNIEFLLF